MKKPLDVIIAEWNLRYAKTHLEPKVMLHREFLQTLDLLSKRYYDVLSMYFGLNGFDEMSYQEIADHYQLTRERVKQIVQKGLRLVRGRFYYNIDLQVRTYKGIVQ